MIGNIDTLVFFLLGVLLGGIVGAHIGFLVCLAAHRRAIRTEAKLAAQQAKTPSPMEVAEMQADLERNQRTRTMWD